MIDTTIQILSYYWTARIKNNRTFIFLSLLLEILSKSGNLSLPFFLKYIIDNLSDIEKLHSTKTLFLVLGYALLWTLMPIAKTGQVTCKNIATEKSINLLTYDIFEYLLNLPAMFHTEKKTGTIISKLTQIRLHFPIFWDGFVWLLVPLILEVTVAIVLISHFYGLSYGLMFFLTLALYSLLNFITAKYTTKFQTNQQENLGNLTSYITDVLLNYEAVKTFCNEKFELDRCNDLLEKQRLAARKVGRAMEFLGLAQNIIIGTGLASILLFALAQIQGNVLIFSDFVLLNTYVIQFSLPMVYLSYAFRDSQQAYTALKEGLKLFNEKKTPQDNINSIDLGKILDKTYSIEFKNVNFLYGQNSSILDDVSFKVHSGQKLAIVGKTGAGKSTISKLLLRLFDINSGSILINGQDISMVSLKSLRNCIGLIPQDTILLNDSLYFNILYGNLSASEKDVMEAIEAAHLSNFVVSLPDGLNTIVGERGVKLSGGERQRIAIARAILKKPKIFIFDEATSSLDSKTEKEIQKNLEQVSSGITTIVIAHRLSTIVKADTILVLDNGQISEIGTHESLVKKGGLYHSLWVSQMKESPATSRQVA